MANGKKGFNKAKAAEAPTTVLHVAAADVGAIKEGQELTTPKDVANYVRAIVAAEYSDNMDAVRRVDRMDDDRIVAIWASAKITSADAIDADKERARALVADQPVLDDKVTPRPVNISSSDTMHDLAVETGKLLDDVEFIRTMDVALAGKDDWDGGPLLLAAKYRKLIPEAQRTKFPVPGSNQKDRTEGDNGPWDKYKVTAANGDEINRHFYREQWCMNTRGVKQAVEIEQLSTLRDTKKTPLAGTPEEYIKLANDDNASLISLYDKKRSALTRSVNRMGKAVALLQLTDYIAAKLPDILWKFIGAKTKVGDDQWDTAGDMKALSQRDKIFNIIDRGTLDSFGPISMGQFLGMKWTECAENGGTLAKLRELSRRKPRQSGEGEGTTAPGVVAPVIKTTAEFRDKFYEVGNYLGDGGQYAALLAECNRPIGASDGNYELILAVCRVSMSLEPLYEAVKSRGVYYEKQEATKREELRQAETDKANKAVSDDAQKKLAAMQGK